MTIRTPLMAAAGAMLLVTTAARGGDSLPEGTKVVRLEVQPGEIRLNDRYDCTQLLVTAETETGELIDATRAVQIGQDPGDLLAISPGRLLRPQTEGSGRLRLAVADQTLEIAVTVGHLADDGDISFVQQVMPTLSKLGCNAGTCHGARAGKNGFKLSLRGYDPLSDHRALIDDLAGRRFNRAAPEQSLMLLKPSGGVPHVGGVRMRPGEPSYEILRDWIAGGVQLDLDSPRVTGIEVFPKEPRIPLADMQQQMRVVATYSDGAVRDVTAQAFVESSLAEVVEADKTGLVTAVRRGEAAVLARYEGAYASTRIIVMGDRSGFAWEQPPVHNFIDELVYQKLEQVKVLPAEICTDATFIRRVYLDLIGLPPDPDTVRAFLADPRPAREKRDELIDRLVGSDEYVEYWTNKWADLLQVNRKFLSVKGAWAMRRWIREAIARNIPYNDFVHTVLTASGSTYQNPPAAYLRVLRAPEEAMENSTQLFLGVRFNCNKCHDHPFERWTQNQYYELAAYFAQVGRKQGPNPGEEVVYDTPNVGEVIHPKTGAAATPSFPYEYGDAPAAEANRREQFAQWVISPENPYFAKSFVNRMWAYLLGAGLIEPIDDIRAGNPPTNPALLDRLTDEFVASGFDVQHVVRLICQSRVYQHSVSTNAWNEDDSINYSHALARRLQAEVLYDAIHGAMGTTPKLPGVPTGFRAAQLPDTQVKVPGGFLDLFGRPPRESSCECERSGGVMLGQALTLVNGPTIADAIADPNNRIARLVEQQSENTRLVEELFLAVLCRPPTETELDAGTRAIRDAGDRLTGAQDLAWALLNSPAFLFNR